jgi:hypothetical protein
MAEMAILASTRIRQTGEFSASTRIRQIRRRVAIAYDKHKRAIFKFYIVHASKKTKSENNILFKLATDIVLRCYE